MDEGAHHAPAHRTRGAERIAARIRCQEKRTRGLLAADGRVVELMAAEGGPVGAERPSAKSRSAR